MVKEILISIYLMIYQITFFLLKIFPQKNKVTFVSSFGDNVFHVAQALSVTGYTDQIIILKTRDSEHEFEQINNVQSYFFAITRLKDYFLSLYHLATSNIVFIDNYFPFLAVSKFKEGTMCIQLWHAAGAIKKFGLSDPSLKYRNSIALKRFHKVYQSLDYIVVGSDKMANIFQKSFGMTKDQIIRSGIPRTDFFFKKDQLTKAKKKIELDFPEIKNKKILMYAPTFREGQLNQHKLELDIHALYKQFNSEYILLMRLHPAIKKNLTIDYPGFALDVSNYFNINHLLAVTDILITDYSSIPFEYALLKKPMIFFAYDLDNYKNERGFWEDYIDSVPGPVVKNNNELIDVIKNNSFDLNAIELFSTQWNKYSNGNSSEKIIEVLYSQIGEKMLSNYK